jgi:DNA-directed RNA polymerase specialized sigma subunit
MSKIINKSESQWKTYGHFREKNEGVFDPQAEPDTTDAAESPYVASELPVQVLALIESGLAQMSQRQRSCMELYFGIGGKGRLSQREISVDLGITPSQVATLVRNGLKHLRVYLTENGIER